MDWGSVFVVSGLPLSACWCSVPPGHWDAETNEAQALPSRALQPRGGKISMVSAKLLTSLVLSFEPLLFPLHSESHRVHVRKLNNSFKNLAKMVSLPVSKAFYGSLLLAE